MRKLIVMLSLAATLAVGVASGAQAAGHRQLAVHRCATSVKRNNKTLYLPGCTKPKLRFKEPSKKCLASHMRFTLPKVTFVSNAGIRTIKVVVGRSHVIKRVHFRGEGRTQYTLRGIRVNLRALRPGTHKVTVSVTDITGKTVKKTLRLSVCGIPRVSFRLPSAQCRAGSAPFKLPSLRLFAQAGIRTVRIELVPSHVLATLHLNGKKKLTLRGTPTNIRGLKPGAHEVIIRLTDMRGQTVTRKVRFTICTPHTSTPVFTG